MSVLIKDLASVQHLETEQKEKIAFSILDSYLGYAERQENRKVFWYLKAVMVIPCVVMVPSIFLMAMITQNFIWFVAVSMILFFANVVVHIADANSKIYIPLYHISIAISFLIPLMAYLLAL